MLHLARYISYYLVEYLVVQSAIYVGLRNDLETFNVAWRYVPNQWKLNIEKVQWIRGIQQCRTYNPKLWLYSQAFEAQTCPCKNGFCFEHPSMLFCNNKNICMQKHVGMTLMVLVQKPVHKDKIYIHIRSSPNWCWPMCSNRDESMGNSATVV